jgi:hypothetical protein
MSAIDWSPILDALVGLVFAAATAAIAALAKWLLNRSTSTLAGSAIAAAAEVAQSVVAHAEVHLRPQVKAALADGHLTPQEAAALKAQALQLLKEALAEQGLTRLEKALGLSTDASLSVYLSGLLERALGLQRASGTLPPPAPASVPPPPAIPPVGGHGVRLSDTGRTGEWPAPAGPPTPR